ncbi:MAG: hypothetical protein K6F33_09815, partial [Bacteroidales bacterium]|nr:hypothetical protein [Bacteroidales bacterium]
MLANKYIAAIATAIAAIISLSPVKAQTDTPGYIPLFDNLQSTDGQGMQKEYNNQLKIAVPQSYEDVDPEETDDALQSLYNAGKLAEAYEFVEKSKSKYRRLSESSKYLKYLIATTKELGYDEKADSLTIQFYHKYPFYKNKATDPPSFVELRSNFYAKPMFAFRASASHVLPRIMIDT